MNPASGSRCRAGVTVVLRSLAGVLLVLMCTACGWMTDSVVVVKNVGEHTVDAVRVEVAGGVVALGGLEAGAVRKAVPTIRGDSSVQVRYEERGLEVLCEGDVYLTNNMRARIEVEIGGGTCRVVDVTR